MADNKKLSMDEQAAKHLGSGASYAVYTDKFDPSLLVPMPRQDARDLWKVDGDRFVGVDIWRAHEATFLLDNGYPMAGTLKIMYPASTENMVESKSMKLFLNSFDMCKMGKTPYTAITAYEAIVTGSIAKCLGVEEALVDATFFSEELSDEIAEDDPFQDYQLIERELELHKMDTIEDFDNFDNHIETTEIMKDPTPAQIEMLKRDFTEMRFKTHLLRSRCRKTKQKDSGTANFYVRARKKIDASSVLRQIIALREGNEFHEPISEKLFQVITDRVECHDLMICLQYARRGGIDITPIRATSWDLIPSDLVIGLGKKTLMQ